MRIRKPPSMCNVQGWGTSVSYWILLAEIIGVLSVGGESESAMISGGGGDGIILVEVEVSDCRHDNVLSRRRSTEHSRAPRNRCDL